MQRIIILSYFFPPCNLTASQRAFGWAKTLNKYGYYPVVITRSWDLPIAKPEDASLASGDKIAVKKEDGYEVHYLPYIPSLRDRLYAAKRTNVVFQLIQKILTVLELLTKDITLFFTPYKNLYTYTVDFLRKNKDVHLMVISANPFMLFKFGYMFHKKYGVKWIADYRDDWNTNELLKTPPRFSFAALIKRLDKKNEKKWVASASCITSISPHYTSKISNYTGKKGHVILNGFLKEDFEDITTPLPDKFLIVYNGTLYDTQPIGEVLEAFKVFIEVKNKPDVKLLFLGTAYDTIQRKKIEKIAQQLGIPDCIEITERKPRSEALRIQRAAHVLLMIAHKGFKGVPSSKIYEYLALERPIVFYPGDKDIVDDTLNPYNIGYICVSETQLVNKLEELYGIYKQGETSVLKADKNYIATFSREHQTQKLAEILDQL